MASHDPAAGVAPGFLSVGRTSAEQRGHKLAAVQHLDSTNQPAASSTAPGGLCPTCWRRKAVAPSEISALVSMLRKGTHEKPNLRKLVAWRWCRPGEWLRSSRRLSTEGQAAAGRGVLQQGRVLHWCALAHAMECCLWPDRFELRLQVLRT